MMVWATVLAALGPALGQALYEVGKKVVAEPLMEPATEQLKERMLRGYQQRVDDAKVRSAVEAAVRASGLTEWEDWADYPLRAALDRLAGKGHGQLRESTVAAALAMTDEAPEQVPHELLRALEVDERHRPDLARFLWAFRQALAKADEDYGALVTLTHQDAVHERLRAIASGVERLASTVVETSDGRKAVVTTPLAPQVREIEESYLRTLVEGELCYLPLEGRRVQSPKGGLRMRLQNVYIALNTDERPPEARGPKSGPEIVGAREVENVSALRVFLDHRCVLLLGEPGSGKTTFVEHLALCLAGERWQPGAGWASNLRSHDAAWEGSAPLPVRIRLREFAADEAALPRDTDILGRARHLLAYVKSYLAGADWHENLPAHVVELFETGDALLVLDGLDEVGDPQRRRQVAEAIGDLADTRFRDLRVVVTCRVAQYRRDAAGCCTDEWALPLSFHCATLVDFTLQQIEDFADRWFGEVYRSPQKKRVCRKKARTLKEAIRDRPDLQEIAPRPILLTQMALVHDAAKLPDTRVELYDKCAELLLWEWERIRAERAGRHETAEQWIQKLQIPRLRRVDIQDALDDAVCEVHERQGSAASERVEIPSSVLAAHLADRFTDAGLGERGAKDKAAVFVSEFLGRRNGLIVPAGEDSFQTPHRTFQEFMAARSLVRMDDFHWEVQERLARNYDLWREVFVLGVGLAGLVYRNARQVVDAVDHLCPKAFPEADAPFRELILAGTALAEVGTLAVRRHRRGPETVERVEGFLKRTMQDTDADGEPNRPPLVPVPTRYAAAETLDRLRWLPHDLDAFIEIPISNLQSPFYIAKYPVTNHQFARFIDAGGYENPAYWGGKKSDAWRWRTGEPRWDWQRADAPDFWDDPRFGKNRWGYPVVGVSWYEVMAYCRWLQEQLRDSRFTLYVSRSGKLETLNLEPEAFAVCLPTEEEWIAAAGGAQGERYPWGPDWDGSRANTRESDLDGTTPVAMYPSGRSRDAQSGELIGAWDMAGNVWEWMADWYDEEQRQYRPLRGGSWGSDRDPARVPERLRNSPDFSYNLIGFRVVVSPAGAGF